MSDPNIRLSGAGAVMVVKMGTLRGDYTESRSIFPNRLKITVPRRRRMA